MTVHVISADPEDLPALAEARPTYYRGPVKSGDSTGTQWRQDMQVEWLKAAIRAQDRRDEPEIDFGTLGMPCQRT